MHGLISGNCRLSPFIDSYWSCLLRLRSFKCSKLRVAEGPGTTLELCADVQMGQPAIAAGRAALWR